MRYECWNPSCPRYAATGQVLNANEVGADASGRVRCKVCGAFVHAVPSSDAGARAAAGMAGGALLGWAVGGPPGALIGGILGVIVGGVSGSTGNRSQ